MKERVFRVVKWLAFPAFYLFSLALFGYLTFPFGRLKDRIVAEFDRHAKPGQHLEIGKLGAYWLTGVEVSGVKLHLPPDDAPPLPGAADFGAPPTPAKESVITIDEAHVRVKILPLLIGRVRVDFWASAFGGEIRGTAPVGDAKGDVELTLDKVDVSKIEPLAQAVGVPMKGTLSAKLSLSAADTGKWNKANGSLDLTVADVVVSDGKTKIQGLIELPPAKLGDIRLSAEAKEGNLKVDKLTANGTDLELVGDGKITLKEPWADAALDLYLKFKFTDAYRGKNATTKTLLGEPGSTTPGLIEMQVPKMKRAKRPDGFFGWHIYGPLKKLKFDPSTADFVAATPAPSAKRPGVGTPSPFGPGKKPLLPLGASTAKASDDERPPPAAPPPPVPVPPERREPPPEPARVDPPNRVGAAPQLVPAPQPVAQPAPAPAPPPSPPPPEQPPEQPAPDQPAPPPDQPQQ